MGIYKRIAKENLQGKWGAAVGATLIYLIAAVLSLFVIGFIIIGPLTVGLALFYLRLTRKGRTEITSLFEPFNNFGNFLVLGIVKTIIILLWSLLCFIPGIAMSYAYGMSEYIMADNPSISVKKAMDISDKMMYGKKRILFRLQFSIMGWILIPALFFSLVTIYMIISGGLTTDNMNILWVPIISGLALILLTTFLTPYYNAAKAAFYEDIKADFNATGEKNQP